MSRVFISKVLSLTCRRCYSIATESTRAAHAATSMVVRTEGATTAKRAAAEGKEVFWMRDPKTGYWVPENRFDQVDAAELRARLLPKRSNHE
ncbi:hypothetical protein ACMD2_08308 [Ananas comosus]|uniref:Protein SENESCENCE-ASSOCIATED GENE 21, mitochondrial-like n=1 Tax=Ananas comosus TaxID=4615 RepID=A0A199VH15_ANACO|nr:hypothetical protein ACMD2_08308 [Ananas comosus]